MLDWLIHATLTLCTAPGAATLCLSPWIVRYARRMDSVKEAKRKSDLLKQLLARECRSKQEVETKNELLHREVHAIRDLAQNLRWKLDMVEQAAEIRQHLDTIRTLYAPPAQPKEE